MPEISFRGGATIGWVHASWPLAKLTVHPNLLVLSGMGRYEFTPSQVVSIEPYGSIPVLNWGIRINHNRTDCPTNIVFRCLGSRQRIFDAIEQGRFVTSGKPAERPTGFPVKWSVTIAAVALWNVLFYLDGSFAAPGPHLPGVPALLGLFSVFAISTATKLFPSVQRIVLRDGHNLGEIREFLSLAQLVTGLLFFGFSVNYLLNK